MHANSISPFYISLPNSLNSLQPPHLPLASNLESAAPQPHLPTHPNPPRSQQLDTCRRRRLSPDSAASRRENRRRLHPPAGASHLRSLPFGVAVPRRAPRRDLEIPRGGSIRLCCSLIVRIFQPSVFVSTFVGWICCADLYLILLRGRSSSLFVGVVIHALNVMI